MNDKNADYWNNRGLSNHKLNRYEHALRDFNETIYHDNQKTKFWINRAKLIENLPE